MKNHQYIIGVVGSLASGKGVLTDYFIKTYGFISFSLSFIVHEELRKRNIKNFTRQTLQDVGDELRATFGEGVLAQRAIEYLKKEGLLKDDNGKSKIVIEGIRNPGEVKYFQRLPHFVLLGVDADQSLRFKRVIERSKPWDPKDWNSFLKVDNRDWGNGREDAGQQVKRCVQMADCLIDNNKDLKSFYAAIDKTIGHLVQNNPSFKEIFKGT